MIVRNRFANCIVFLALKLLFESIEHPARVHAKMYDSNQLTSALKCFTSTILRERKGIGESREFGFDIFTVPSLLCNMFIKTDYPCKYAEFGFLELLNSTPPPVVQMAPPSNISYFTWT